MEWTPPYFLLVALFGGCGILYLKSLPSVIRRIFTDSKLLCAISITLNARDNLPFVILLICVYLPTDYSTVASHSAFSESRCELHGLISAEHLDNVIIAGDFNVDFSRPGPNCSNLSAFMLSNNLISVFFFIFRHLGYSSRSITLCM